ncbi:GDSL esterase/lipase At2g04570-like [Phoenix dactylifera]|uniref:GDSL esterase/lipase At2g04570-like n=1 Tax=Phoenix dactylifera TaxID=42345 RepID=A0A8B7D300_PHODC|nr:GDSL esterase/lipase At2g04570-like [Phoenix dactylifera]
MENLLLLLPLMMLWFPPPKTAAIAEVPAIIVFGDSTVDSGNNNRIPTLVRSNFRPYGRDFMGGKPTGRFSNGRLATDFYSEFYGLGPFVPAYLDPLYGIEDFATRVCFASAGSGLDVATSNIQSVIPLWMQVRYYKEYQTRLIRYLGEEKAEHTLREAAYVISIGTNDFIENYFANASERKKQFTIGGYVDFLTGLARDFIKELYALGARKIGFTGLGPIGCVPLERSMNSVTRGSCVEEYNKAARDFNAKLQTTIDELCAALPGIQLKLAPLYDFFLYVVQNRVIYGFENVEFGCCATGTFEVGHTCNQWSPFTCPDARKYAFWDAVHPTEKMSQIIAEHLINTTFAQFK